MMKNIIRNRFLLIVSVITILFTACTKECQIIPTNLLCEAKMNPVGIATSQPGFSWKNNATANKSGQNAYHILAASSPSLLKKGKADFWDSGKIESS